MSGRREEAKGGTRRCRDTAFTWCAWESPRSQCGQGGFVLLALACTAARRLGESAPRWPAGSPAQWQRPRMWICVGPRDPSTKPSRGWLRVVVRKPRLVLFEYRATRNKVTAKQRSYCRGCPNTQPRATIFLPGFRWDRTQIKPHAPRSRWFKQDPKWHLFLEVHLQRGRPNARNGENGIFLARNCGVGPELYMKHTKQSRYPDDDELNIDPPTPCQ